MKKLFCALAALLLALSLGGAALAAVPDKPDTYAHAYDFEGSVLSSSDIAEIERYGIALEEATGIQAVAVVVDFLDGMDPADYATDLINTWGIGDKDEDNGVVLLLARGDRQIQIGTGTGVDRVLTGSRCGQLIDDNIDYFANNQFGKGMRALYADVCTFLAKAQGKTLSVSGAQGTSGVVGGYEYEEERRESSGGFLDTILTLMFIYIVFCVLFNSRRGGGGCLRFLFLGWLFDQRNDRRNDRRPPRAPRPPRPPMGGFGGGPRFPRGGFGGGFGGGSHGGFGGGSRGGFGGGGSRGGGGGRGF